MKCNAPHPDNDNPGAVWLRARAEPAALWNGVEGGMFCDREKGHDGPHRLIRHYDYGGEEQQWGGDIEPNSWTATPFLNLEIDVEASQLSSGGSPIYRLVKDRSLP